MKYVKQEIFSIDEEGNTVFHGHLIPVSERDENTLESCLQKIGGCHAITSMSIYRITDADNHEESFNKQAIKIIRNRINQLEKVIETLEKYDTSD